MVAISQIRSLPTRETARRDYGYSAKQQYGKRSPRKIRGAHLNADGSTTYIYSDGSTEIQWPKGKIGKAQYSHKETSDVVTISKGELAKLKANYAGEKVFDKGAVTKALAKIDALQGVPASIRREIVNKLWEGYNARLHSQGFELFTDIMWDQLHATVLQENGFDMTEDEIRVMDEQIGIA